MLKNQNFDLLILARPNKGVTTTHKKIAQFGGHFCPKMDFWPKIDIFCQKRIIFSPKIRNFGQKSKFC